MNPVELALSAVLVGAVVTAVVDAAAAGPPVGRSGVVHVECDPLTADRPALCRWPARIAPGVRVVLDPAPAGGSR